MTIANPSVVYWIENELGPLLSNPEYLEDLAELFLEGEDHEIDLDEILGVVVLQAVLDAAGISENPEEN